MLECVRIDSEPFLNTDDATLTMMQFGDTEGHDEHWLIGGL